MISGKVQNLHQHWSHFSYLIQLYYMIIVVILTIDYRILKKKKQIFDINYLNF